MRHYGEKTTVDQMEGREPEINAYISTMVNKKGHVLSGSRRNQIRQYILRMLTQGGANLDRKKIKRAKKSELRLSRGGIKWLSAVDAAKVARNLKTPYREMFQIQVAIGLRPDELLTLHKNNFENDFTGLTLAPLDHLTLKTGSRFIPIPSSIRALLKLRVETHKEVLFPNPKTGKTWKTSFSFNKKYREALRQAANTARLTTPMDCRTGRRTCASLLMQQNVSADKIAKLLGNTAAMILEHYGDPDVKSLDLERNSVGMKAVS